MYVEQIVTNQCRDCGKSPVWFGTNHCRECWGKRNGPYERPAIPLRSPFAQWP